jgi:hypothetical protein
MPLKGTVEADPQPPVVVVSRPPAPTCTQSPDEAENAVSVKLGTLTELVGAEPAYAKVSALPVPLTGTSWMDHESVAEADPV